MHRVLKADIVIMPSKHGNAFHKIADTTRDIVGELNNATANLDELYSMRYLSADSVVQYEAEVVKKNQIPTWKLIHLFVMSF